MTEVVTGEAVVLDVPCAQFPSRLAALLLDMVVQIALLIVVVVVVVIASHQLDQAEVAAILVGSYVLVVVGYPTVFETLTRGKTLGKMAIGLRVVSDDGGAVRFRQALVRALTGAIEIWTFIFAPVGLILSMLSAKGKRLGDMFAGTYVIQERAPRRPELPPALAAVPPPLLGWAQVAEISRLSDQNAEAASSYLRRLYELRPAARDDLGLRIATAVLSQVSPPPPPGTPPAAYLAAVLAIRRDREFARLASQQPAPPAATPPPGPWAQPVAAPPSPGPWTPPPGAPSAGPWAQPTAAAPPPAPPPATWPAPPGAPSAGPWAQPTSAAPPAAPPPTTWTPPPGAPSPSAWTAPPGAPSPSAWTAPPAAPAPATSDWTAPPGAPSPGAWPPPPSPSGAPPPAPYAPTAPAAVPPAPPGAATPAAPAFPPGQPAQDEPPSDEPSHGGFAPPA